MFSSEEQLTDQDDDDQVDIFAREAGATTLVSFDPTDPATGTSTSTPSSMAPRPTRRSSPSRLADQLSDDDADSEYDLYVRSGDDVSLVTGVPGDASTDIAYQPLDISTDGSRVLFVTSESLLDADVDAVEDLYLYDGGALHLVSVGTVQPVFPEAWNPTLGAVVFGAADALVPEDTDTDYDLYLYRHGGPRSLVTSTTTGVISSLVGNFVSADGSRVVFESVTPLTPGETEDGAADLYLWSSGAEPRLLTGGTAEEDAVFMDASTDASRVFFRTFEALLPSDTDTVRDIYEATTAGISQVSRGNADETAQFRRSSADGSLVFWQTAEPVLAADTDAADDVYVSRIAAPKNLTPPTITGQPAAGQTLTCNPGTWSDAESFAYRWNRDGTPIPGATSPTYVVPAGDAGHVLTCTVTATGDGGSAAATSAPVTVAKPTPTGPLPGPCANAAVGTAGADVMRGTEFGDLLLGLAGRDRLHRPGRLGLPGRRSGTRPAVRWGGPRRAGGRQVGGPAPRR